MVQRTLLCNPSILGHPGSPPGNLDLSTTAPFYHTTASPCMHGASGVWTQHAAIQTDHIPVYLCHPSDVLSKGFQ